MLFEDSVGIYFELSWVFELFVYVFGGVGMIGSVGDVLCFLEIFC